MVQNQIREEMAKGFVGYECRNICICCFGCYSGAILDLYRNSIREEMDQEFIEYYERINDNIHVY